MSATGKWDAPNELLRVVLGIPVGAVDLRQMHLHGHSRLSFAEQEVLDARRRHDALQYLKNDREAFHHAAVEAAGFSPADDLRELEERVDSLKERVQRANVKAWVGRRVIERLRTSPVIGESFFGPDVDTVESSALREMVQERDALSVQLIKELQTLQRLQEELAVAEQEAQTFKLDNRQVLKEMSEAAAAAAASQPLSQSTRAQEDLEKSRVRNVIVRNVLQNLILGSGIDWAQDDQVMELMLRLEDR